MTSSYVHSAYFQVKRLESSVVNIISMKRSLFSLLFNRDRSCTFSPNRAQVGDLRFFVRKRNTVDMVGKLN